MSANDVNSDDGASGNTSPTVYTRGDNTLWDDNELIRLWNEQLECENISRSAETEDEKHRLEAAIRVALDDQESQEKRGALNSHQDYLIASQELQDLSHEEQEEEEWEEEENQLLLERELEPRESEQKEHEKRKRKYNNPQLSMEDNDSQKMASKAAPHYRSPRQEMYLLANEKREQQEHRRRQSYPSQNVKSSSSNTFMLSEDDANASDEHFARVAGCESMSKTQQNYNSRLLSVNHLPDDVRVLVESFYNAGFEAGYYVARRETNVQRKTTRDNSGNQIVSSSSNINPGYYDSTKRKRFEQ